MRAAAFIVIGGMMLASIPVHAQVNTEEERVACEPDVIKLCFWSIPSRPRIIQCMQAKHDELSPRCRDVFDAGMRAAER